MFDAVIAGGGPAGLTAALYLGRARRSVLVCDTGEGRNAPSHAAHGFFTRDGTPPAELRRIARDQLAAYPSVMVRDTAIRSASRDDGGFALTLDDGETVRSRTVILATGIRDELPQIDGLASQWGRGVVSCPFCDGWELRDTALAMLVDGGAPHALERLPLIRNLSRDLVVLTNGVEAIGAEDLARLDRDGVPVIGEPIARIDGAGDRLERVVFASGAALDRQAMFILPAQHPRTDLAVQLGCELTADGPPARLVAVDPRQGTTVPGVFAAGDVAHPMAQVSIAVASGATAGIAAIRYLLYPNP